MSDAVIARERFLDAAGVPMFVREYGEGDPIVLLHGFPQTSKCWHKVAQRLADRHHVIAPDLPGYGRSGRPVAYDIDTLSRTVLDALDAAGVEQTALAGHDWGGALTYRLAMRHPDRITRAAVINAPFRKLDLIRAWHIVLFNMPVLPEALLLAPSGRAIELVLRLGSVNKDAFDADALQEYRQAYSSLERLRSALAYYRTVSRTSIMKLLPLPGRSRPSGGSRRIEQPFLLIWGMKDPVLPPSLIDSIVRDIPQTRVERIHETGHFVPEERPERVAELLRDFLAETASD